MSSTRQASRDNSDIQIERSEEALLGTLPVDPSYSAPKKGACDRCRGQKLRCIWDTRLQRCHRCHKANAVCTLLPPRPMGRPPSKQQLKQSYPQRQQQHTRYQQLPLPQAYPHGQQSPDRPQHHPYQHNRRQSTIDSTESLFHFSSAYSTNVDADMEISDGEMGMQGDDMIDMQNSEGFRAYPPLDPMLDALSPRSFRTQLGTSGQGTKALDHDSMLNPAAQLSALASNQGEFSDLFSLSTTAIRDRSIVGDVPALDSSENAAGKADPVTQLTRLNMALHECLQKMNTSFGNTQSPPLTPMTQDDLQPVVLDPRQPWSLDLGRVLTMTEEFKTIVDQLGIDFPGSKSNGRKSQTCSLNQGPKDTSTAAPHRQPYDHSTALLVLSCYVRLKETQNRALSILHHLAKAKSSCAGDLPEVLPNLAIGRFSLAGQPGLQLTVMTALCEEVFSSIKHSGIDGKSARQMDWAIFEACLAEKSSALDDGS